MTFFKGTDGIVHQFWSSLRRRPRLRGWRLHLQAGILLVILILRNTFEVYATSGRPLRRVSTTSATHSAWPTSSHRFLECLSMAQNANKDQCLSPRLDLDDVICSKPVRERRQELRVYRLPFCPFYYVYHTLDGTCLKEDIEGPEASCRACIKGSIDRAIRVQTMLLHFESLMDRFDCKNNYSERQTCSACRESYKHWLCSSSIPYYWEGNRIPPCGQICRFVENHCPYLLPQNKHQYAGESNFLCTDSSYPAHSSPEPSSEPACFGLCKTKDTNQSDTALCFDPKDFHTTLPYVPFTASATPSYTSSSLQSRDSLDGATPSATSSSASLSFRRTSLFIPWTCCNVPSSQITRKYAHKLTKCTSPNISTLLSTLSSCFTYMTLMRTELLLQIIILWVIRTLSQPSTIGVT